MFPLLLTRPNNLSGPGLAVPDSALLDDDSIVLVDDSGEILIQD